jgi:hypothetical protein
MEDVIECPIWRTAADRLEDQTRGDRLCVRSHRTGGDYCVTGSAAEELRYVNDKERLRLTNWLLDQRHGGDLAPLIDTRVIERIAKAQTPLPTHSQRFDSLLKYFERETAELGGKIRIRGNVDELLAQRQLEMRAYSSSLRDSEVNFLTNQAEQSGFVQVSGTENLRLTLKGYDHLLSLRLKQPDSQQAFVAMWFDRGMTLTYEGAIAPAIAEAGYKAMRIDQKEHSNKVDDEIIAEIRKSRFVVADFTSERDRPRGGVYFEAGFAQGLGLPVIWTCREDLIDQLHFDTRQFNHIAWRTGADLKTALRNRIVAVIGPGPSQASR